MFNPFPLLGIEIDELESVLRHRTGEFRAQNLRADLQRLRIAGEEEVHADILLAREDPINLDQHPVRGDVEAACEDEAAVFLERDFDFRDRAKLPANRY